jgi:hypothetical protein
MEPIGLKSPTILTVIHSSIKDKQPFEIKRHFEMILKKLIESMNKQLREKGLIK